MSEQWVAYGRGKTKADWIIILILNEENHEVFRGGEKEAFLKFEHFKLSLIKGSCLKIISEKGKVTESYIAV